MAIELTKWDVAEHLQNEEDLTAYFDACLEGGDPKLIAKALGNIAHARGMAQVASQTGLSYESLYRALSGEGNPEFATIMKVVNALGLKLHAAPTRLTHAS
jgi:probable addiction module antidote protein